jgi:hypothetical protein
VILKTRPVTVCVNPTGLGARFSGRSWGFFPNLMPPTLPGKKSSFRGPITATVLLSLAVPLPTAGIFRFFHATASVRPQPGDLGHLHPHKDRCFYNRRGCV